MLENNTEMSNHVSLSITPLIEELKNLMGASEFSSGNDPVKLLENLTELINNIEEIYSSLLAECGLGSYPDTDELKIVTAKIS